MAIESDDVVVPARTLVGRSSPIAGPAEPILLGNGLVFDGRKLAVKSNGTGQAPHTHPIADITDLQTELNGKAATVHTHPQSEVTNLTADLANKVATTDPRLSDARVPTGNAGGDLGGTYANPTVTQARGLRESGGATLSMGAVADGQYLRRSGATITGGTPSAADPGGWNTIVKSANQDVTNAQNQDATELQFSVVAGNLYAVELYLFYSGSDATGDFEYRFAVSAGTMDGVGHDFGDNAADAVTNLRLTAAAAANTANVPHGCVANVAIPRPATAQFTFRHNTTNGTFKVQFGNNAAAAGRISRMLKGSILRWKQLT